MKSKWDNIFWYQRKGDSETQLENNTTKGFLKVLQESDDALTSQFLQGCLGLNIQNVEYDYEAQIDVDNVTTVGQDLHLVGLSYDGRNVAANSHSQNSGGIADGAITAQTDPNSTKIILEVKTGRARLDSEQMGKYRKSLDVTQPSKCHGVQWFDIFEMFEGRLNNAQRDLDRFLLEEYTDYLNLMNMVPFRGFDPEELGKSDSTEYKRSLMAGKDQNNSGAFAEALDTEASSYGLGDFIPVSNQKSTQIHMMPKDANDAGKSFTDVNHFTAGFWHGKFNLQLNVRRRVLNNVTKRKSSNHDGTDPDDEFVDLVKDIMDDVGHIEVTTQNNPLIYVRYQRNFPQENDDQYRPSAFDLDLFSYAPNVTSDQGIEEGVNGLARSVRESKAAGIGSERSLVFEKRIPYTSEMIQKEELVEYSLEYFKTLFPLYEHFAD